MALFHKVNGVMVNAAEEPTVEDMKVAAAIIGLDYEAAIDKVADEITGGRDKAKIAIDRVKAIQAKGGKL